MALAASVTMTSQSLRMTLATKERYSAGVWSIGREVSSRYDAKNTAAIASASATVACRSSSGILRLDCGPPPLSRPDLAQATCGDRVMILGVHPLIALGVLASTAA